MSSDNLFSTLHTGLIFKNLTECFYFPSEKLSQYLDQMRNSFQLLYPEMEPDLPVFSGAIDLLGVDYSRLFLGPYKLLAAPYGSLYLENERRLFLDSSMDALQQYQEESLEMNSEMVPDHIAIELEFIYFLITKQIFAIENGDLEKAKTYRDKQATFIERHLGAWIHEFTQSVIENANTEFYRKLAITTENLVQKLMVNESC